MKSKGYLLDSNVVIKFIQNLDFGNRMKAYSTKPWFISVVTHFEILKGAEKQGMDIEMLSEYLNEFTVLKFDETVSCEAIRLSFKNKNMKFKDLIIAATTSICDLTLLTFDRDFKSLGKGIDRIILKHEK